MPIRHKRIAQRRSRIGQETSVFESIGPKANRAGGVQGGGVVAIGRPGSQAVLAEDVLGCSGCGAFSEATASPLGIRFDADVPNILSDQLDA
ncbi:MAG: hypothetical protein WCL39_13015, partial [Armatimonadota bacterium]